MNLQNWKHNKELWQQVEANYRDSLDNISNKEANFRNSYFNLSMDSKALGMSHSYLKTISNSSGRKWDFLQILADTPIKAIRKYEYLQSKALCDFNTLTWELQDSNTMSIYDFSKYLNKIGLFKCKNSFSTMSLSIIQNNVVAMDINRFFTIQAVLRAYPKYKELHNETQ